LPLRSSKKEQKWQKELRIGRVREFPLFPLFLRDNKYYPHEIIIVPQSSALPLRSSKKEQKWQKGLRRLIRKIPLFNFLKFLTLKS